MAKDQINFRVTQEARELVELLVDHFTDPDTGRRATQAEVVERAIRCLAAREKIGVSIKKPGKAS